MIANPASAKALNEMRVIRKKISMTLPRQPRGTGGRGGGPTWIRTTPREKRAMGLTS